MKVKIHGATPMDRLTNFTRGILAVPKSEIEKKKSAKRKQSKRK